MKWIKSITTILVAVALTYFSVKWIVGFIVYTIPDKEWHTFASIAIGALVVIILGYPIFKIALFISYRITALFNTKEEREEIEKFQNIIKERNKPSGFQARLQDMMEQQKNKTR